MEKRYYLISWEERYGLRSEGNLVNLQEQRQTRSSSPKPRKKGA